MEARLSHQDSHVHANARAPQFTNPDAMIQARGVAERYDISMRTLDRWLQKPRFGFPRPVMVTRDVAGRVAGRFWRLGDLIEFERRQAELIQTTAA
jgi:predicted DNA-binding transcriptional regulator AlpA